MIAKTPKPPYYAVIFTSKRTTSDPAVYERASEAMVAGAKSQPGFLGYESTHNDKIGITVSYWSDLESIRNWKANKQHRSAQAKGRSDYYEDYFVRISKVERDYSLAESEFENTK